MIYPVEYPLCTWEDCILCYCCVECSVYISSVYLVFIIVQVFFFFNILLICLNDLLIDKCGVLKSPIIIALLFFHSSLLIFVLYIYVLWYFAYICTSAISFWHIDLFTVVCDLLCLLWQLLMQWLFCLI